MTVSSASAFELAAAIARGERTARDAVQTSYDRADAVDAGRNGLNLMVSADREGALESADKLVLRSMENPGPLPNS